MLALVILLVRVDQLVFLLLMQQLQLLQLVLQILTRWLGRRVCAVLRCVLQLLLQLLQRQLLCRRMWYLRHLRLQ